MSDSPDIPRLETAFRSLAARMERAPGFNPALSVVAAGFRPWQGQWVGAVVTPWAIQLVLLAGEGTEAPVAGARRNHVFPSGERTLLGLELEGYGPVETGPLVPTVTGFQDQRTAEQVALAAFSGLFTLADLQPVVQAPSDGPADGEQPKKPVSRRDFIRGRLFGR